MNGMRRLIERTLFNLDPVSLIDSIDQQSHGDACQQKSHQGFKGVQHLAAEQAGDLSAAKQDHGLNQPCQNKRREAVQAARR